MAAPPAQPHRRPLPPRHRPLIGREQELATASCLLSQAGIRLLTLRGPGGIGKSRLALEIACQLAPAFDLGAVWVDLAPLRSADQVLPAVANALGARASDADGIRSVLEERGVLLILDNFEHLPLAAADVAAILALTTALQVLVTSRSSLHLRSEHELRVGPLGLARSGRPGDESAAVQFFLECAWAVDPQLGLTQENRPLVEGICRQLDGVPLALELAAARLRAVPLAGLARWLERPLDVLTDGPSDGPHHGESVRTAIDWSFELLTAQERTVFTAAAVFVGGFTLSAMEAVVGVPGTRDTLIHLSEHSLIQPQEAAEPRWRMLEPVRAYAQEKLDTTPNRAALSERCAAYFLDWAEGAESMGELLLPQWHEQFSLEQANLEAVLGWFVQQQQAAQAFRLLAVLGTYWGQAGTLKNHRWLKLVLALPGAADEPALLADALCNLGLTQTHLGQFHEAQKVLTRAVELSRTLGDADGEATSLQNLASVFSGLGQHQEALELFGRVEALFEAAQDDLRLSVAINNTGVTYLRLNQPAQAARYFERMHELSERLQYDVGIAIGLTLRGWAAYLQGQPEVALPLARAAWRRAVTLPHALLRYVLLHQLAFHARDAGQLVLAAQMVGCSDALRQSTGSPWDVCFAPHVQSLDASLRDILGTAYEEERMRGGHRSLEEMSVDVVAWLDAPVAPAVPPQSAHPLSTRELDVLRLLIQGASDKKISQHLRISPTTVSKHVSNMLGKLGLHNRVELTRWAAGRQLSG